MPVTRCANGKYRIGNGPCVYDTESKAQAAYRAYLMSQRIKKRRRRKRG